MLTTKQISEIKEHLEKAQNPIFFYDNDADGLCGYLLLARWLERGKGVAIKSYPEMDRSYFRKVLELNADYIFILDKPVIDPGFWEEAEKYNFPIVWIDHHDPVANKIKVPKFVNFYNVMLNKPKTDEPVTALCYQLTNRKEDLWIAVAGCVSDKYVPDFYKEFKKKYPEFAIDSDEAFEIYYKSKIGLIAKMFGFGLKDSVSNVVAMQKFLIKAKNPQDVLEETKDNYKMHKKVTQNLKRYDQLLQKAKALADDNGVLFFRYGGDLSISSDLANELHHSFPEKIIVVAYVTGGKVNISMRGENCREIILKAVKGLAGAGGGGHEHAVGGQVRVDDLEKFRERVEEFVDSGK